MIVAWVASPLAGPDVQHFGHKTHWLALREVTADWPMQGKPRRIGVDNTSEFHSQAFERGVTGTALALIGDRLGDRISAAWWSA